MLLNDPSISAEACRTRFYASKITFRVQWVIFSLPVAISSKDVVSWPVAAVGDGKSFKRFQNSWRNRQPCLVEIPKLGETRDFLELSGITGWASSSTIHSSMFETQ